MRPDLAWSGQIFGLVYELSDDLHFLALSGEGVPDAAGG